MTIVRIKPRLWWPGINRQDPLAQGLVALWPFWERAGNTVQNSFPEFNGTNNNGVWSPEGMVFNNGGDRVDVTTTALPVTGMTVFFRARFIVDATHYVMAYGPSSTQGWRISGGTGAWGIRLEYSSGNYTGRGGPFDFSGDFANVWQNVAITVAPGATTDGEIEVYRNASRHDTKPSTNNPFQPSGAARIGSVYGSENANLEMSHIGIYNRVLTLGEIRQLHEDPYRLITPPKRTIVFGAGVPPPPPAGGVPKLVNRGLINTGPLSGLVV